MIFPRLHERLLFDMQNAFFIHSKKLFPCKIIRHMEIDFFIKPKINKEYQYEDRSSCEFAETPSA